MLRKTHRAKEPIITAIVGGIGVMSFKYTCGATGTDTIRFVDQRLPNMKDADYAIRVSGETAARVHVDESLTIAEGFTVLHTGAGEILHCTVQGKIVGLPSF